MGHRDSPAQHGGDGGFSGAGGRAAEIDAARGAGGIREDVKSVGVWFALGFLRFYQIFLGPFFGGACKFHPSCSKYAYEAIEKHGVRRGFVLAMKRLGRCRPFTQGGFDPVPEKDEKSNQHTGNDFPQGLKPNESAAGISELKLRPPGDMAPFANIAQGEQEHTL